MIKIEIEVESTDSSLYQDLLSGTQGILDVHNELHPEHTNYLINSSFNPNSKTSFGRIHVEAFKG